MRTVTYCVVLSTIIFLLDLLDFIYFIRLFIILFLLLVYWTIFVTKYYKEFNKQVDEYEGAKIS